MKNCFGALIFSSAFMIWPLARAEMGLEDKTSLQGFISYRLLQVDSNDRFLSNYAIEEDGFSFTHGADAGVNLTSKITNTSKAAVQLFMNGSNGFTPELDLAFGQFDVNSNMGFSVGRLIAPIWMFSEEQSVGYSYAWLEAPSALYKSIPLRNFDGLALQVNSELGPGLLRLKMIGGAGHLSPEAYATPDGGSVKMTTDFENVFGVEGRYLLGQKLSARYGYFRANTDITTEVESENPLAPTTLYKIKVSQDMDLCEMYSSGLDASLGKFRFIAEHGRVACDGTAFKKFNAAYGTLVYEWGNWTPHFTYSAQYDLDSTLLAPYGDPTDALVRTTSSSIGLNFSGIENTIFKVGTEIIHEEWDLRDDNDYFLHQIGMDLIF